MRFYRKPHGFKGEFPISHNIGIGPPTGMKVIRDIWLQSKGDWYEVPSPAG